MVTKTLQCGAEGCGVRQTGPGAAESRGVWAASRSWERRDTDAPDTPREAHSPNAGVLARHDPVWPPGPSADTCYSSGGSGHGSSVPSSDGHTWTEGSPVAVPSDQDKSVGTEPGSRVGCARQVLTSRQGTCATVVGARPPCGGSTGTRPPTLSPVCW